jgi:8-amino-7-oxononanoate synthase
LSSAGLEIGIGDSPIIPIILGDESKSIEISRKLADAGLLVQAVRPPTVPPGTSRLRLTLCCEHSDEQVALLIDSLIQLLK